MKILLASSNRGKQERYKMLAAQTKHDVEFVTPEDCALEVVDVIEDASTLQGNSEKKARAYFGKTDLPIIANDTGFYIEGEGLIDAPKRHALEGLDERRLSEQEVCERLISFWQKKARAHGGRVDAAWIESYVLIMPDSTVHAVETRREVILTDQILGEPHVQLPVRCLYISKRSGKPALEHNKEDELKEMQPIVDGLNTLLEFVQ